MSERRSHSGVVTWRVALNSPLSGISSNGKHVGLSLANYMSDAGDQAFPSPETLHEDATLAVSTVRAALVELQRAGWIVKTRQGGGRGKTNEWASTIPDSFWEKIEALVGRETRRDMACLRAARKVARERSESLLRAARASGEMGSTEGPGAGETSRTPARLPDGKPADTACETRRRSRINTPGTGTEVEDLEGAREGSTPLTPLKGGTVVPQLDRAQRRFAERLSQSSRLQFEQLSAELREELLEHYRRATGVMLVRGQTSIGHKLDPLGTDVDRAAGDQRPSPDEFVAAWLKTGSRSAAKVASLRNLVVAGLVDEAHELVDDWVVLTQVERNEYHSLVDELASDRLPEPVPVEGVRGAA